MYYFKNNVLQSPKCLTATSKYLIYNTKKPLVSNKKYNKTILCDTPYFRPCQFAPLSTFHRHAVHSPLRFNKSDEMTPSALSSHRLAGWSASRRLYAYFTLHSGTNKIKLRHGNTDTKRELGPFLMSPIQAVKSENKFKYPENVLKHYVASEVLFLSNVMSISIGNNHCAIAVTVTLTCD